MRSDSPRLLLWVINLLVPGGGVILAGGVAWGLGVGALFSVLAGLLITAIYIVPAEYSTGQKWLLGACVAAVWAVTQFLLAGQLRSAVAGAAASNRRDMLARAQSDIARGEPRSAIVRLETLANDNPRDLHIAVRLAEALTAANDPRAEAAWRRVHALDRHHIYGHRMSAPPNAPGAANSSGDSSPGPGGPSSSPAASPPAP